MVIIIDKNMLKRIFSISLIFFADRKFLKIVIRNINSISEKIFKIIFSVIVVSVIMSSKKSLMKLNKQITIKKFSASLRYFFLKSIAADTTRGKKADTNERKSRNMLPVLGMIFKYGRSTGFQMFAGTKFSQLQISKLFSVINLSDYFLQQRKPGLLYFLRQNAPSAIFIASTVLGLYFKFLCNFLSCKFHANIFHNISLPIG